MKIDSEKIKLLLKAIPQTWMWIGGAVVSTALIFFGWQLIERYTDKVEDVGVVECNNAQLKRDLATEKANRAKAEAEVARLQTLVEQRQVEYVDRVVFRDRVITEVREVQAEVLADPDRAAAEALSDTTKTALKRLSERNKEMAE